MTLTINEREFEIKFAYIPTVKSGLIKKLINLGASDSEDDHIQSILSLLPELLLVGLQKNHYAEFGCSFDDKSDVATGLNAVGDLIDAYCEQDDVNLINLFNMLLDEVYKNGFLSKLLVQETKKTDKKKIKAEQQEN